MRVATRPAPSRRLAQLGIGLLVCLSLSPDVRAFQDPVGDVIATGAEVVLRAPEVAVKETDQVVATGERYTRYRVEAVDGARLKIASEGIAGWVSRGEVFLFDRAIDLFTAQVREHPESARPYWLRGRVRVDKGEYDDALSDFDEAIRLDPRL